VLRLWGQLIADSLFRAPWEHLDVLRQDVRYTFRSLRRAKVFALTAIATIALGVGANTAIFSVVHAVALRPLPYEAADRLVRIWERNDSLGVTSFAVSLPNYATWRARARSLDVAGWRGGSVTLRGKGDPARVTSVTISPDYFRLLSVKPVAGRVLTPADENPGAGNPAVIRDSLWRRQFDADPGIVGSSVSVGGQPYTVVGIIPEDSVPLAAELYMPLRFDPAQEDRDNRISNVIARIRPGFTFEQAQAEMQTIARQIEAEFPASNKGWGITMSTVYDWLIPEATRNAMYVLLGTVGCLLLIACANVANLLLARGRVAQARAGHADGDRRGPATARATDADRGLRARHTWRGGRRASRLLDAADAARLAPDRLAACERDDAQRTRVALLARRVPRHRHRVRHPASSRLLLRRCR
jgi:putative ABC transport system permease protein